MIIVDTNIVSEVMRPRPDKSVLEWFQGINPKELYLTSVTQAEILYGIELLPYGKMRRALELNAREAFKKFSKHTIAFDTAAALQYPVIAAERRKAGRSWSYPDLFILAIAKIHNATIATRNVKDFIDSGVEVVNPFDAH